MKKRVISGAVYAIVLLAFFLIKIFVPQPFGNLGFDALIYFFALVGTGEMLRAMDDTLTTAEKWLVRVFSLLCVPVCAVSEALWGYGIYAVCSCFFVLLIALFSLLVFKNGSSKLENIASAFLCAVYPTLLLCLLVLVNHLGDAPALRAARARPASAVLGGSTLAMVFIFTVSPVSDVLAFFTGLSLRRKFPKKLAPNVSPNKTVVGFIGGIVGGAIAGAAIYFIYHAICGDVTNMILVRLPVYIGVGLVASIASAFGDLVESAIKRQRGIKDMGNIMPGHGGVLDRIDGTLFATIVVYVAFALTYILA